MFSAKVDSFSTDSMIFLFLANRLVASDVNIALIPSLGFTSVLLKSQSRCSATAYGTCSLHKLKIFQLVLPSCYMVF